MKKKILSLAVIAAMVVTVFSGCTADDVALFKALQNEPETSVTKETATFDVSLIEPLKVTDNYTGDDSTYDTGIKLANYLMNLYGGLLSIVSTETTTTKSGDVQEVKTVSTMPDLVATSTSWVKTNEDGTAQTTAALPSYLKPFLPPSVSGKEYITIDTGSLYGQLFAAQMMSLDPSGDLGVIGGADGPTSVFVTGEMPDPGEAANPLESIQATSNMLNTLLKNDAVVDQLASILDVSIVTEARRVPDGTAYTVKLDSANVQKLIRGVIGTLEKPELAAVMALFTGMPLDSVDGNEALELPDEVDETVNQICAFIADSGILENGYQAVVTVNSDGYVAAVDESFELMLDAARIWDAAVNVIAHGQNVTPEDIAAVKASMTLSGKFKIAVKTASQVTDINRPVSVKYPELTKANNIDYMNELADYSMYSIQKNNWDSSWDNFGEIWAYAEAHQPGDPLILRNTDTGAEVVTVPITTADVYPDEDDGFSSLYFKITDVAKIIPGISYSWNDELMGVELKYTERDGSEVYELYPSSAGEEMYLNAVYGEDGNSYNTDTVYSKYTYVDTYGMFYDNKFYVEYGFFNHSMKYRSRFEDGRYCYTPEAKAQFTSDMDMSDNLFAAFADLFGV